jgi:hypothetical protein
MKLEGRYTQITLAPQVLVGQTTVGTQIGTHLKVMALAVAVVELLVVELQVVMVLTVQ